MTSHRQPLSFFDKLKALFQKDNSDEPSAVDVALAACNVETEKLSGLYASLALRVANLEAELRTQAQQAANPPGERGESMAGIESELPNPLTSRPGSDWFRILRHMLPYKVRRLLFEHDRREQIQSEVRGLRDQLVRERLRENGLVAAGQAVLAQDTPAFPKAVFEPTETSKIAIVDVGAQDLVSEEHMYTPLQRAGATSVVGFEPLPDTGSVPRRRDPNVAMLNHFVGAGGPAVFHVTRFDPASSLFKPNMELVSQFMSLPDMYETVSTQEVQTIRLDDVREIGDCDYLKIDVQGGELDVLKGATRLLDKIIAIHCEVEFAPVYRNQPLFAEIDTFLRSAGFDLIDLVNAGYNRYWALPGFATSGSRLLWAEAIYFKSPPALAKQGAEKLLKAAYIAHVNHAMYDVAAHYLAEHDKLTGASTLPQYSAEYTGWIERTFN
ncbi:hypothetical protein CU048_11110 [Beijerinckiaceae bacterium]|nr:hypothetical protein CU048_11110 [Beijerinckiaceae bacterium]